ncbi:MAG: hypothetical protein IPI67_22470 [Myxococcales bacterium]|nr:hypothetical protein [Myxococcales bacterium]
MPRLSLHRSAALRPTVLLSWCLPALVFASLFLVSGEAQAYTWMLRHNYFGCGTCHADPSGGGLLTPYGRAQGDLLLRMRFGRKTTTSEAAPSTEFDGFDDFDEADAKPAKAKPKAPAVESEPEAPPTTPLWGLVEPPSWLLVQGEYRHMTLYKFGESDPFRTFPMQLDLMGQATFGWFRAGAGVGGAKVPAGSPHARRAQVTTNQSDGWNVISRSHWLGADFAAKTLTLRVGRIEMPFGVRIPEHTMWAREVTHTDRESDQQHGVAVAYSGDRVRGEVMGIAGNFQLNPDRLRERGYSAYVEVQLLPWANAGASSLLTHAQTDFETLTDDVTRQAHGVFGRLAPIKPLVVLVEADVLKKSRFDLGYVSFVQLDLELVQGLHLLGTAEVLDAGYQDTGDRFNTLRKLPGFGRPAFGAWGSVDWFFLPQLEMRVDLLARQAEPTTLLAQLHVYL